MRNRFILTAAIAAMFVPLTAHAVRARGEPALTGIVSSAAEGAMEGVVVTATKPGSIVRVSVTTDAQGRYMFPKDRLEPGKYELSIRAVGYELSAPATATLDGERVATASMKLRKAKNLAHQLTNAEWFMSIPGGEEQKKQELLDCTSCHTLERIMLSTHDADEWTHVIARMKSYANVSHPVKPQLLLGVPAPNFEQYREQAEYFATINLSSADHWRYALKTLPRPKGRDARAIVTEYDLVRPTIAPHDVLIDKDGSVWYTDFGEMFIGKFEPKTLKLTEYPIKQFKENAPAGLLCIEFDRAGNIWFDMMFQGAIGRLNPKSGEISYFPLAPEFNDDRTQFAFVGLRHEVDNKVWTVGIRSSEVYRVDLATKAWEMVHPTSQLPGLENAGLYTGISDSKNNLWLSEFTEGHLARIDAKTKQVTWYTPPTPHARLRRLSIDDQDRIIGAEYRGGKVAVFDPKTEKFTEYGLPPYNFPYRADIDRNGEIWVSTMHTDRIVRVNPKTGETVQYLLPSNTNMRTIFVDNATTPVTIWVGSAHDHRLVKVEPLE